MKSYISSRKGNAIMISIAITGFLFVAAAGASKVITASLRDSTKIVDNTKALYGAESALESALYEATARSGGYERTAGVNPGDPGFVGMNKINSSTGSWSAGSKTEADRVLNPPTGTPTEYTQTLFIPPRRVETGTDYEDLSNWRKVKMGETITFNLWVDNTDYTMPLKVGDDTTNTVNNTILPTSSPDPLEVYGPNGIPASQTKSIFGSGTEANNDLESMYIDLLLPVTDVKKIKSDTEDKVLLSWKLEGITNNTDPSIPKVITVNSLAKCAESNNFTRPTGVICQGDYTDFQIGRLYEFPFIADTPLKDPDKQQLGRFLRIQNPMGIIQQADGSAGHLVRLGDFIRRQNLPTDLSSQIDAAKIYFPRLVIQMGPRYVGKRIGDSTGELTEVGEAYIRLGFKMQDDTVMSTLLDTYPLPDDKIQINATGTAGNIRQHVGAEIHPQELAPMFDYAIFQQ